MGQGDKVIEPVTVSPPLTLSPCHPQPSAPSARWRTRTRCRGGCRCPRCGLPSSSASPPASHWMRQPRRRHDGPWRRGQVAGQSAGEVGRRPCWSSNRVSRPTALDQLQGWLSRRADSGRLLAAGAGCGAGHRGDGPGRVARGQPHPGQEPVHGHARALRLGGRAGRFLVSATRLGGLHGYGDAGATAPLGGAVTGFTKAYNVEQGMRPKARACWSRRSTSRSAARPPSRPIC